MHPAENGDGQTPDGSPAGADPGTGPSASDDVAPPGTTPSDGLVPVADVVRVRRAPRYRRFVQVGVLLGVLIGVLAVPLLADAGGGPEEASTRVVLLFVVVGLALVGALVGAVLAVLLDRSSRR